MEVCGTCHWSGKGFGDVVRVKREYAEDETNTETSTFLQMFLGGPGAPTRSGRAIHWHADPRVKIEFIFTDGDARPFRSSNTRMRRAASAIRRSGHNAGAAREGHLAHDGLRRLP